MNYRRHTLLDISDDGRRRILDELAAGVGRQALPESCAQVILPDRAGARVPGVVRREEGPQRPGFIPVGFSGPLAGPAGRVRLAAFVRPEEVLQVTSPFELPVRHTLPARNACLQALGCAIGHARELGLALGVWGSAAQELYTGLPNTHADSDLDLLVKAASGQLLARFLDEVSSVAAHCGLRIDVELELPNGYGVQLKEFLGAGRTVIGKSTNDVVLFPRRELLAMLPQDSLPRKMPVAASRRMYVRTSA